MTYRLAWNAVLRKLIDQRAGQYEVEKLVNFADHRFRIALLPSGTPEDSKNLDRGEQRPVQVDQARRHLLGQSQPVGRIRLMLVKSRPVPTADRRQRGINLLPRPRI